MGKEHREAINAAYELEISECAQFVDAETRAALFRIGTNPAEQFGKLRHEGDALIKSTLVRARESVDALIDCHLSNGDRDAQQIATQVELDFVLCALATLPGAGIYASLRGNNVNAGLRLRESVGPQFESLRTGLAKSILPRVRVKLPTKESAMELWISRVQKSRPVLLFMAVCTAYTLLKTAWNFVSAILQR